MPIKKQPKQLT